MKKLGLLMMPLMAISLLTNCGGGNKPAPTYTITFDCRQCKAFNEDNEEVTSVVVPVVDPSHNLYKKFHFTGDGALKTPLKSSITVKKTGTEEKVDYEYANGKIFIPIIGDLTITAKGTSYSKSLEDSSWDEIAEISATGRAEEFFDLGKTKSVMVNGVDHNVRIIGFNQDKDKDGNNIGITFEFANLISDNAGYSIATQWNDTNDIDETTGTANHDYMNSSLRRALNGEGGGHILWAQKGATEWSNKDSDIYKDKSVLEMLPTELTNVLIGPQKTVKCYKNKEWSDKSIINNKGEYDKLFVLSPEEMGSNTTREGAYTYYQEPDDTKIKLLRIKKQVNGEIEILSRSEIPINSGQTYKGTAYNYAGWNEKTDASGGGTSWLRSPAIENTTRAFCCSDMGHFSSATVVYNNIFPIAPAFCI